VQKYSYLVILLSLFACSPQQTEAPSHLLNQSQMSDIIADMHLADAIASANKLGNMDSLNQESSNLNAFILNKYQVTKEQFDESFAFYKKDPLLMDSVYAEVITKLSRKEMEYRGK
jgi:hypothetical protein